MPRPLVKHPHPLADRQPDARPMLGRPLEDAARLVEIAAGVQHEFDPQSVPAPFFDLVEVPAVGVAGSSVSSSDKSLIGRTSRRTRGRGRSGTAQRQLTKV